MYLKLIFCRLYCSYIECIPEYTALVQSSAIPFQEVASHNSSEFKGNVSGSLVITSIVSVNIIILLLSLSCLTYHTLYICIINNNIKYYTWRIQNYYLCIVIKRLVYNRGAYDYKTIVYNMIFLCSTTRMYVQYNIGFCRRIARWIATDARIVSRRQIRAYSITALYWIRPRQPHNNIMRLYASKIY